MGDANGLGVRRTRVMIVDDDPLARYALRSLVEAVDGVDVVTEAAGSHDALQQAEDSRPELALVDVQMGDADGLQLTRALVERHPGLKVLVVSVLPEDPYALEALRSGAWGYLRKEHVARHIQEAVMALSQGLTYLAPSVAPGLLRRLLWASDARPSPTLTPREREVLALLSQGLSNKEIASRLHSTVRTVKAHISHILQKLNVQDRTQAALLAVRLGMSQEGAAGRPD